MLRDVVAATETSSNYQSLGCRRWLCRVSGAGGARRGCRPTPAPRQVPRIEGRFMLGGQDLIWVNADF